MTATHDLDILLGHLTGETRPIVADALDEAGRYDEAALLRSDYAVEVHWDRDDLSRPGQVHRGQNGRVRVDPEGLLRFSDLAAQDHEAVVCHTTVTTDPLTNGWPVDGVATVAEAATWKRWLDRVHAADCRLWELEVSGRNTDEACRAAGVEDAEWEELPAALEEAVRALELVTLRLVTAPGTNATEIGSTYGAYEGVSWRNSVDTCDSDGNGRVFLDCQDEDTAAFVAERMEDDDNIVAYERV